MYSELVMKHFEHPHNMGEIKNADGVGTVGNPVCVLPNTRVYTNPDTAEIQNLNAGDLVLSHDGFYHKVTRLFKRRYKGKLRRISVHHLGELNATPDHNILAIKIPKAHKFINFNKFMPDWYAARELEKGDFILYPIAKKVVDLKSIGLNVAKPKYDFRSKGLPEKIPVNEKFLRLAGYYLSEGYVRTERCKGTVGFVFGAGEMSYVNEVIGSMRSIFSISPANLIKVRNSINVFFYSARLARFFAETFGEGAANKKLPSWALYLPFQKQQALLCGLWRGDGYVNKEVAKYVTISRPLAYQLRSLLLRKRIIFSFLIAPENGMHKESYCFYVKHDDSLKKVAEIVGKTIEFGTKKKNPHKSWFQGDYYYTSIHDIKDEAYSGEVLNLEVEGAHSYVSEAACLHNCGDVMKLYIKVKGGRISQIKFKTMGCAAAIATSSMVTDLAKGKTLEEAMSLTRDSIAKELGGLPPIKMHCSNLAADALHKAVEDYYSKKKKG